MLKLPNIWEKMNLFYVVFCKNGEWSGFLLCFSWKTVRFDVYILLVQSQCECKQDHTKKSIQLRTIQTTSSQSKFTYKTFIFLTVWLLWIKGQLFWVFSKCLFCRNTTTNKSIFVLPCWIAIVQERLWHASQCISRMQ